MHHKRSIFASLLALLCLSQTIVAAPTCRAGLTANTPGTWYTKADNNGYYHFYNDAVSSDPQVFRGVSLTGFETGTRMTGAGAGYWMFQAPSSLGMAGSVSVIENVVSTLVTEWKANTIRIPFCGSAWLQDYQVKGYGGVTPMGYRDWLDIAVCKALSMGVVVILDLHLWAVAKQTSTTMEDGCTGINKVGSVDSCAPKDWFGQYTSARTGKTYNQGDAADVWQCAIANADGITLENAVRGNNKEHFLNLWHELALRYKDNSYVHFELFNEPYQRKAARFGSSYGDNLLESEYDWNTWSDLMNDAIKVIRGAGSDNAILVAGLDWDYDFLGDPSSSNVGPIGKQSLIQWKNQKNIAYTFHPYQHGACCGEIGSTSDLSATDPYQSAFCLYPPTDNNGNRLASNSPVPAKGKTCDTAGYSETTNKKSPPCVWQPYAKKPGQSTAGLCAGDREECDGLSQTQCNAKNSAWQNYNTGGWSKYVLPMNLYGPLVATEFGSFDCSSEFSRQFVKWAAQFGASYTVWSLWFQNSGGPGAGACGYPSVMAPAGDSDGFGMGPLNCLTEANCKKYIIPLAHSGVVSYNDIHSRPSYKYRSPPKIDTSQIPGFDPSATPAPTTRPSTSAPTKAPTSAPTNAPTSRPATGATSAPTAAPTTAPTPAPTTRPATGATSAPTAAPTAIPTPSGGADFIIVQTSPGSGVWWLALAVQSGSVKTSKVELVDYHTYSTWTAFTPTEWGYWSFNAASELSLPITIRLTSEKGQQLVLFHVITSFTSNIVNTYMTYGSSGTTAPTNAPTSAPTSAPTQAPATSAPTQKPTIAPTTTPSPTSTPSGNVQVQVHPSTTAYWFGVAVTGGSPATSVSLKDSGSITSYTDLSTTTWGYFIFQPSGAIVLPISLRITSAAGTVEAKNVITSFTNFNPISTGAQYGGSSPSSPATSAPTNPATNAPTQAPSTPAPTQKPTTAPTSPSDSSNIKFSLHEGSNPWWFAIGVNSNDVATVEIKDSGRITSFKAMDSTNWGYWILTPDGGEVVLPVTLRATSKSGKQATGTINALTPNTVADSGSRF